MKSIWQYGRTGGKYVGKVLDDSVISVPYTDVPPLKGIELADQFFIPTENRWQELENTTLREKLENLECLYEELKKQDECKSEQIQQMGQLNATLMMNDIQLANQLAEVRRRSKMFSYEQIERMYLQGFFTAEQVRVFVPLAISEKQLKKLLTEVE